MLCKNSYKTNQTKYSNMNDIRNRLSQGRDEEHVQRNLIVQGWTIIAGLICMIIVIILGQW